ncbi:MAG: terminase small subunit [Clostridia bacterium]
MKKQKEYTKKIEEYIELQKKSDTEIPTLAGLAVFLGISKERLVAFEFCSNKPLKESYIKAKNQIEHLILSKAALKLISSSTAHFYLQSAFGYAEKKEEVAQEEKDYVVEIKVAN